MEKGGVARDLPTRHLRFSLIESPIRARNCWPGIPTGMCLCAIRKNNSTILLAPKRERTFGYLFGYAVLSEVSRPSCRMLETTHTHIISYRHISLYLLSLSWIDNVCRVDAGQLFVDRMGPLHHLDRPGRFARRLLPDVESIAQRQTRQRTARTGFPTFPGQFSGSERRSRWCVFVLMEKFEFKIKWMKLTISILY